MSIRPQSGIDIAAAGYGERMKPKLIDMGLPPEYPKLLLPTGNPNGETLVGRIIRQALDAPIDGPVVVHTNVDNHKTVANHPNVDRQAEIATIEYGNTFLPFVRRALQTHQRVLGSHGDYYAEDLSWQELLDTHESNDFPVTFAVARSEPIERGAVFKVNDRDQIVGFTRTGQTNGTELLNVGAYIFDPSKNVLSALRQLSQSGRLAPEETIVTTLIERDLLGAYIMPGAFFNINTPSTYESLRNYTASRQQADQLAAS